MTDYFERDIALKVLEALKDIPVVVITGMRQTGKTTFLQKQPGLHQRRYVTFDDFSQLEAAKLDPDRFVSSYEPLTIDEAHKCPEILTAIKKAVDKKRIPGQFLLSGSANFAVLKGISESLAGRSVYFTMHPFSRRETAQQTGKMPFIQEFFKTQEIPKIKSLQPIKLEEVLIGGMPSVALRQITNRSLWFKGYEQTYLERDIREISQIGNIIAFRNLLHLAILRTGQLLNPSGLARDSKMNVATTSRYLSLLETSFIIYRLAPYLRNRASRLIKSPKIYVSDSGLGSYLTGVEPTAFPSDEPLIGALFETYAAQNLLGIIDARWPEARLHFWNVQGRHEVDFVIEAGRSCIALEIKSGARWEARNLSGLKAFLSATPHCKAALLGYNGPDAVRLGDKMWAIPLSLILS
jgi:predicted AAA+ superfamily ATPase